MRDTCRRCENELVFEEEVDEGICSACQDAEEANEDQD